MMRRGLWTLLAFAFVVGFGSAAMGAEKEIVFNLGAEPRTIDPVLNNAVDGTDVIDNIFEGLLRVGLDALPEPGCAERWEQSEDGASWTFHLRPGLKWSDGTPLTAEHFRYGLLRVLDSANASPYAYLGFFIKNGEAFFNGKAKAEDVGLVAVDDATLRIDLEYPSPLMLDYLAFGTFMPARPDVVEKDPRGWSAKAENFVCNGPFVLVDWKHNSELTIVKNSHYWDAENVKVDTIRMVMITDSNTALAAFKSGKIDFLKALPPQMVPKLLKDGEAKTAEALGTAFCVFNVKKPPFDNLLVRQAFNLAVDRTAMVEKVTMGGQKPAVGFIPTGIPGVNPDKDFRAEGKDYLPVKADPEGAKKLLAEAGYPDGKGFPKVTYKYNLNPGNKAVAEALQAMWKQNLGVEVELSNEEWKVFIDTRNQKNFQIARHAYLADFFDGGTLLELWQTGVPENVADYANPEYDALIRDSLKQMDRAKRMEALHKAEDILIKDAVTLPIYFYVTPYMTSGRVKGIYQSPYNYTFFRNAEVVQ